MRWGRGGGMGKRRIDESMSAFFDAELSSSLMQARQSRRGKREAWGGHGTTQQKPLSPAFDAYVVLDFEATCEQGWRIPEQEIIEFPMVIVESRSGSILAEFQRYVRPVVNPKLSAFCTQLTGITQTVVEKAQTFPAVFESAMEFLQRGGYGEAPPLRSYLFVTCGDWDLRTILPSQLQTTAKVEGRMLSVPPTFRRWCNIKRLMQDIAASTVGNERRRIGDLPDMMAALNLRMTGRHHSGIDDCRNIVAILQRLMQDGHVIAPTADHSGLMHWIGSLQDLPLPTSSLVPEADCPQSPPSNEKSVVGALLGHERRTQSPDLKLKHTPQGLEEAEGGKKKESTERPIINVVEGDDPLPALLQTRNRGGIAALSEGKTKVYSKALTRILRHAADSMGISISSAGYVCVDDVLRQKPFCDDGNTALAHIALVVHSSDKQRFKMVRDDNGRLYIRANQGHSLNGIHPDLRRIANATEAPVAIHGTYYHAWERICACGYLSTMRRQHIHFAKGLSRSEGVISGMRGNVEVLLYLDVGKALSEGVELWESANGVLLTPGVGCTKQLPLTYIARAVDRRSGGELLPGAASLVMVVGAPQAVPHGCGEQQLKMKRHQCQEADASLRLARPFSLEKIVLCDMPSHCYIIGTDAAQRERHVLSFAKSNSDTLICDNCAAYTSDDIEALIARVRGEANARVLQAKALLGCIRFTKGYYLLVATRRRQAARLGFHRIFEVLDIELVSLCPQEVVPFSSFSPPFASAAAAYAATGKLGSPFLHPRTVEDYYRTQLHASSLKQNFFYSHTYDLTNTLQANMTASCREEKMRSKFLWNEFLVEPFFAVFSSHNTSPVEGERPGIPAGFAQWTVYLVQGSVVQCPVWCGSRLLLITLIGRASKNFAGARYLRRGVNSDGHVANHVEVEQIVVDESTLHTHFTSGAFSSYVQVRGSVPLHWFHPPTQLPKPSIKLGVTDSYYSCTRRHFQELLEDYGAPLIILNLLRQHEKRPRESILSRDYRRAVETLNSFVREELGEKAMRAANGGGREMAEVLLYHEFDIREVAHDAWNNSTALAEEALEKTSFFVCNSSGTRLRWQEGVVRSNCLDCVDRTNLVQFFFGLHALGHQMHALGLLYSPVDLTLSPSVQDLLLRMYLLMGDAIAVQYGGSPQVGAGVLNRGTGWDKIMGIKRLYNNIIGDREKQSALNLFLGRYQPYPNMYSTAHNPVMRIPDADCGGGNNINNNSSTSDSDSIAAISEGRVGRVVNLSEIESDYYLQVKGAPSLPKPEEVVDWWKGPLRRFRQKIMPRGCQEHEQKEATLPPSTSSSSSSSRRRRRSHSLREEEKEVLRSICLSERAAAMKHDTGADTDEVGSSGSAMLQDGEVCLLQPTTAANTLVARRGAVVPCRHISVSTLDLVRDLMNHREEGLDSTCYNNTALDSPEMLHDHHAYPDEVRASVFYREIEAVRRLGDQCEPHEGIQRMQLAVLAKFGDPVEWNVEMVVEALMEVAPEVSSGTLCYLRQMNVDGYILLHRLNTESMGDQVIMDRFINLVRQLPRANLEGVRQCLAELDVTVSPLHTSKEGNTRGSSGGSVAFPDATCCLLRPFFREALYSATLAAAVRLLLREMADKVRGVPRGDRLRYRERANQSVPPATVASQCFSANELHRWLLQESRRLGLTLHEHAERHERSQAGWRFMHWLAHAGLISQIIIEPTFGVVVQPAIKRSDFASRVNLFTLRPLQEMCVLNRWNCSGGLDPAAVSPSSSGTSLPAVAYAESLVSLALGVLSSVQEMSVAAGGEATHDSAFHTLLDSLLTFSTHLVGVDFIMLRPRERWCFWVNLFNALYIHAWLAAPGERAQDYTSFYYTNGYDIGGYFFSLNDIKSGILRGNKPAYFSLLPPFDANDPRLTFVIMDDEAPADDGYMSEDGVSGCVMVHCLRERILLTLIDAYLVPDNLEDAPVYNPRVFFNEEEQMNLETTMRSGVVALSLSDMNDSEEDDDGINKNNNCKKATVDAGDEEEDPHELFLSATRVLRRASGIPVGAATWFASWFGQRHSSRSTAFTHPCLPLIAATLPQQIYAAEGYMLRSLGIPVQPMAARNGIQLPRTMLPLLLCPEEFGATPDEVLRRLHQWHLTAAGQMRQVSTFSAAGKRATLAATGR